MQDVEGSGQLYSAVLRAVARCGYPVPGEAPKTKSPPKGSKDQGVGTPARGHQDSQMQFTQNPKPETLNPEP